MSEYTKRLHKLVNGYGFVRCFYGECPVCERQVFSVDEDVVENNTAIKAKFVCECGKKWKETVYSRNSKKYKYRQALVEDYRDRKKGMVKVLKMDNRIYLVTPDKIMSKEVKK